MFVMQTLAQNKEFTFIESKISYIICSSSFTHMKFIIERKIAHEPVF